MAHNVCQNRVTGVGARRALEREEIDTLSKLADYTEHEILRLHGMGPSTIPKLRAALRDAGLAFKAKRR